VGGKQGERGAATDATMVGVILVVIIKELGERGLAIVQ
jgi:hypothetical protein